MPPDWPTQQSPYDIPRDPAAFDRHYREVHQPLTARCRASSASRCTGRPGAVRGSAYHQVVDVTWSDWDAVERAFASPEDRATAADMANLDAPTRNV